MNFLSFSFLCKAINSTVTFSLTCVSILRCPFFSCKVYLELISYIDSGSFSSSLTEARLCDSWKKISYLVILLQHEKKKVLSCLISISALLFVTWSTKFLLTKLTDVHFSFYELLILPFLIFFAWVISFINLSSKLLNG